ncbi:hypothetical protein DICPUDRAFT_28503 [Dictyostelium purpureum]|uniref:Homing endonuclease LAGLIDADG domain-containing protein n=1 Tax=Dictyostelium purpureum TaxID=5786 RepID=F0ZBY3_DICPU|nr:uncharacterized protein DICPUDRAFT_28503 [Dictyostelium purpureum]EGC38542.1 hypothetical protein DICPUDRAFT_28503 [Dictyostelium purpureum]|eukprot:XP_003284913.1 hypothetical protein DICPUDRAFT_28503 [Dictyostelium purpureum]
MKNSNINNNYQALKKITSQEENQNWCQWLGGLIDASGQIVLKKDGEVFLEISLETVNYHSLATIKHRLGGGHINVLGGNYTCQYKLSNVGPEVIKLINGHIRHPSKQEQLRDICNHFGINYKPPLELTPIDFWISGVYESIGKCELNIEDLSISITLTDRNEHILTEVCRVLGGRLVYYRASNGTYKLHFQKKEELERLFNYFDHNSFKIKSAPQIKLVPEFYKILMEYEKKGNTDSELPLYIWECFLKLWNQHKEEYYDNKNLKNIENALENSFKKDKIKIYNSNFD